MILLSILLSFETSIIIRRNSGGVVHSFQKNLVRKGGGKKN
jgi:hypothetical protein